MPKSALVPPQAEQILSPLNPGRLTHSQQAGSGLIFHIKIRLLEITKAKSIVMPLVAAAAQCGGGIPFPLRHIRCGNKPQRPSRSILAPVVEPEPATPRTARETGALFASS
jgi:hypothetical protein